MEEPLYFFSPEQAVSEIRRLLRNRDYATLARYCDPAFYSALGSQLVSGIWFLRRPEDPPWLGEHVRPFPPMFHYAGHEEGNGRVVRVVTVAEIDQGDGALTELEKSFCLASSEVGFQLLPESGF